MSAERPLLSLVATKARNAFAQQRLLSVVLVGSWLVAIAATAALSDGMTDPFWQAREGVDVLAGGGWLHPDRWALHAPAHFVPTSPGWQVLLGLGWRTGGVLGVYFVAVLTIALALWVLVRVARRLGAAVVVMPLMLAWLAVCSPASLTFRASFGAIVLVVFLWCEVDALLARSQSPWRVLWVAVCAFCASVVGIWMHASWAGYGLLAAAGCGLLWARASSASIRERVAGSFFIAVLGTAGVTLGPVGLDVWHEAARVAAVCRDLITEWMPPWQSGNPVLWMSLWCVVFGSTLISLWLGWASRREATSLEMLLLALGLSLMATALLSVRFLPQAAPVLAPVLAAQLTRSLRSASSTARRARMGERATGLYWSRVFTGVGVALCVTLAALQLPPFPRLENPAIAALPPSCRLFSDAASANLVLLSRQDVRPWIDGRADMWGRDRLVATQEYLYGVYPGAMLPTGIDCVLLRADDYATLAHWLASQSDWAEIARTDEFIAWRAQRA